MKNFLIIGLGNPGDVYAKTRHNIGFMVLDSLLENLNLPSVAPFAFNKKINSELATVLLEEKIYLMKPMSFMNLSGIPTATAIKYLNIQTDNLLIIHDDIDLPFGQIRLSKNSASGGHNGIGSIIECLHSKNFTRLRIGISTGFSRQKIPTEKFVLGKFSPEETFELERIIASARECIESFLEKGLEETMNKFN